MLAIGAHNDDNDDDSEEEDEESDESVEGDNGSEESDSEAIKVLDKGDVIPRDKAERALCWRQEGLRAKACLAAKYPGRLDSVAFITYLLTSVAVTYFVL